MAAEAAAPGVSFFVDSSVLYAAADSGDSSHQRAVQVLAHPGPRIITDHVLVETWLLARARRGPQAAERIWGAVRSGGASLELVTLGDIEEAWRISEDFPDQDFSIVDRTSFAAMRRLGLNRVASFDSDFAVYRHGPERKRAFELL